MPETLNEVEIRGPAPEPRTYATAMTTYRAPEGPPFDTEANGAKRWLAGVTFSPFGCQQLQGSQMDNWCDTAPLPAFQPNLEFPGENGCVTFDPFQIRVVLQNKPLSGGRPADIEFYVTRHSELSRSVILAREVMRATLTPGNPSLTSEADTVTGLDSSAVGALAAVEDALGVKLQGGLGMVHMTPGMLQVLSGDLRFDSGTYRTATGHVVVADAGYTNRAPGAGTVVAGDAWIYGSGPVYAKLDNIVTFGPLERAFQLEDNTETFGVQQVALAYFDPCAVMAAKVTDIALDGGGP